MRIVKEYSDKTKNRANEVIADWECPVCEKIIYQKTHSDVIPEHFRTGMCYRCVQLSEWAWKLAREIHAKFPYKGTNGVYGLSDDLQKLNISTKTPSEYFRCYQKRLIRNGILESEFIFSEPKKSH